MRERILLCAAALFVFLLFLRQPVETKKVTIHIPYRVQNVKHTHTVYKIIPHFYEENGDDAGEEEKHELFDR